MESRDLEKWASTAPLGVNAKSKTQLEKPIPQNPEFIQFFFKEKQDLTIVFNNTSPKNSDFYKYLTIVFQLEL